jgi:hypothetical protein
VSDDHIVPAKSGVCRRFRKPGSQSAQYSSSSTGHHLDRFATLNEIISEFSNFLGKSGTPSEYQASKKQLEVPQSSNDRSIRDRSPLTEWRMTDEPESSGRNTRLEITLVFVAGSSQLIIYFHRIVNLPLRGGKQYATYVKVIDIIFK